MYLNLVDITGLYIVSLYIRERLLYIFFSMQVKILYGLTIE